MTTVRAALREGSARLTAAGISGAVRDARLLMASALGIAPVRLTLAESDALDAAAAAAFARMLMARSRRQPVSQILGRRNFCGREFEVTPDVLDPRPETEALVALALAGAPPASVLDLGTGSGALLVTLLCEWPEAEGLGTDTSAAALAVASRNAARHGVARRAAFAVADWTAGIGRRFDLVVSNPPYIPAADLAGLAPEVRTHEPHAALTAGPTGLEAYAAIARGLGDVLAPGGRALFEIAAGRGRATADVFKACGFRRLEVSRDLDGRERVVSVA